MTSRDIWPWPPQTGTADTETMMTETSHLATVRGEAASFTSNAFLSMVLDRTTDGVVMTDGHGVIVYANLPLLQLFGYGAEDLIGQPVEILLPDYLRDHHRHHVQDFLANPTPRPMGREDLDIEGRRADGSLLLDRRSAERSARYVPRGGDHPRHDAGATGIGRLRDHQNRSGQRQIASRSTAGFSRSGDSASVRPRHVDCGQRSERIGVVRAPRVGAPWHR